MARLAGSTWRADGATVRQVLGAAASLVALASFLAPAAFAQGADTPVWTDHPVKVDRKSQDYERLEAKPVEPQKTDPFTLRFTGKSRYAIVDSVTFEEGGKRYRLTGLDPVPSAKICIYPAGGRWACGLRARAALGGLITGRPLRCAPRGTDGEVTQVECRRNGKDLGEALVASGSALAAPDAGRYEEAQAKARGEKAGIWSESVPAAAP